METHESVDDAELENMKRKLSQLEQKPTPEGEDAMVDYLSERFNVVEEAIKAAEAQIIRERNNRRAIASDLEQANDHIKDGIEGQKANLLAEVQKQMNPMLEMAVRDRMKLQSDLDNAKNSITNKTEETIRAKEEIANL